MLTVCMHGIFLTMGVTEYNDDWRVTQSQEILFSY